MRRRVTGGRYYQVQDAADLGDTFEWIGGDLGAPDTDTDTDGPCDAQEADAGTKPRQRDTTSRRGPGHPARVLTNDPGVDPARVILLLVGPCE